MIAGKKTLEYDKIALRFQRADESFDDVTRPMLHTLLKGSSLRGKKVLDLGCGYGHDMHYFHQKGATVFGVDHSKEMIKLVTAKCRYAKVTLGSLEKLPYKENYFDFIFSRYAIQHCTQTGKVFSEVHRVLKPKGHLLFMVTHPLRQYIEKTKKDYWHQESISSCILGGRVTVTEPSHIFEEYASSFLLKNFELLRLKEEFDPGAQKTKNYKYPGVLICYYKKR